MNAPPSVSDGILEVEIIYGKRKAKHISWIGPNTQIKTTKKNRVVGVQRALLAAYFVKRGFTSCVHKFDGCMAREGFPDLIKADYDHLDGIRTNNIAGNFAPSCAPCNKIAQGLQWKSIRALASAQTEREREVSTNEHPHSSRPTSGETASSWKMFPKTVEDAFHPIKGRLARLNDEVLKDWWVNNLPEIVGMGRSTTYAKYVHEFVKQGYLTEEPGKDGVRLVRTGKKADELLWRELGIRNPEQLDREQTRIDIPTKE